MSSKKNTRPPQPRQPLVFHVLSPDERHCSTKLVVEEPQSLAWFDVRVESRSVGAVNLGLTFFSSVGYLVAFFINVSIIYFRIDLCLTNSCTCPFLFVLVVVVLYIHSHKDWCNTLLHSEAFQWSISSTPLNDWIVASLYGSPSPVFNVFKPYCLQFVLFVFKPFSSHFRFKQPNKTLC